MSPTVQKVLKLSLKSVASLLVIVLIALLLLLWRLSSSPIELNRIVPMVQQASANLPGGLSVRLQGIGLYLNRAEREIDLKALNVEVVESSGTSLVSAPEVNISLSLFALMRGVVALSSIELDDVDIQLVRREDGSFKVFRKTHGVPVAGSDEQPKDFSESIRHIFKILASDPDVQTPLSYLKRLKIRGTLEIEDRKNNLHWTASAVESLFVGHDGEVEGDLGVTFSSPRALAGIHVDIALNLKGDGMSASLEFAGIRPAGFAPVSQKLAALAGLDMSIHGTINTTLTLPDRVHSLTADIRSDAGQLSYPDFYPVPLRLESLDLQLSADLRHKTVQVSSLDILLGDQAAPVKLRMDGTAQMLDHAIALELQIGLQQLKVQELDVYWPATVASGARKWLVNNLDAGTVNSARLDLAMQVPRGPETAFQLSKLNGTLAYSDLTVAYFGSLPAATGVSGSGTFDQRGFDLDIRQGLVNGVSIEAGKVIISGMHNRKAAISIQTHLSGQLAAIFAVLEAPPISLNSEAVTDVASEKLDGQVEADFGIALPLRSGLKDGELQFRASGKVSGGGFRNLFGHYGIQQADIDFELDQSKVNFKGPMLFSGIPLTVDWSTALTGPRKGYAGFSISAPDITDSQISALGVDISEYMQGSAALQATAELTPGGLVTASIETDFNNAALAVPKIHWSKAAGDGGTIDLTLSIEKNHLHAQDIHLGLGSMETVGKVEFDIAGKLMSLSVEQISMATAQLKGLKLEGNVNEKLQLSVQGGELSLAPFLSGDSQENVPLAKQVATGAGAIAEQAESGGIIFEIGDARLDKVYINQDTYFDDIQFSATGTARAGRK